MKKFLMSLVLLAGISAVFAQVSVDPTDRFYQEAQGWELKGFIDPLPLIRPYPANVIKSVLEKVIECGSEHEVEIAKSEYLRIFNRPYSVYVTGTGEYKTSENLTNKEEDRKNTKNIKGEGGIAGEVLFSPLVSFGYDLGMYAEITDYEDIAPYYVNKAEDSVFDPVDVGPISMYLDWNTNVSVGKEDLFFTAGISKTGYGPYLNDGLALNDTTFHSANIIFNVNRQKWSYASSFEIIGATSNNPDYYQDHSSGKYLSFHVAKYRLNKYLDVSYYENILFGPRVNLAYLFPVPYMPVQNIGGANDNLQMGLMIEIKPTEGVNWATDIFVDDLEVNDIVKLHFDTKIRVAGQTGIILTPKDNACTRMTLNYQMVLPYVYSHWEYKSQDNAYLGGETVNYQNYTNSGVKIGSVLDPNSDKVSFSANFQPKPYLRLNFATNFIRHCNSAEAFDEDDAGDYVLADENQYITDGSVNMHQMYSNPDATMGRHVEQAWDSLGFMTSDHKLGIMQALFNGEVDLPRTKNGHVLTFFAGYTFEYVKNKGVTKNIYTGGTIDWTAEEKTDINGNKYTTYTYNGTNYDGGSTKGSWKKFRRSDDVQAVVKAQKQAWIDSLKDVVNHYITLGFRYTY